MSRRHPAELKKTKHTRKAETGWLAYWLAGWTIEKNPLTDL